MSETIFHHLRRVLKVEKYEENRVKTIADSVNIYYTKMNIDKPFLEREKESWKCHALVVKSIHRFPATIPTGNSFQIRIIESLDAVVL